MRGGLLWKWGVDWCARWENMAGEQNKDLLKKLPHHPIYLLNLLTDTNLKKIRKFWFFNQKPLKLEVDWYFQWESDAASWPYCRGLDSLKNSGIQRGLMADDLESQFEPVSRLGLNWRSDDSVDRRVVATPAAELVSGKQPVNFATNWA